MSDTPRPPRRPKRRMTTSWTVRLGDVVSRAVITVGGIGTILAVLGVCLFLLWVAAPMFGGASVSAPAHEEAAPTPARPVVSTLDNAQQLAAELYPDGTLFVFRLKDGGTADRENIFERPPAAAGAALGPLADALRPLFPKPTAVSTLGPGGEIAFGFGDGSVRLGKIVFEEEYLLGDREPPEVKGLAVGQQAAYGKGVAFRTPANQISLRTCRATLNAPIRPPATQPVTHIDQGQGDRDVTVLCTLGADHQLRLGAEKVVAGKKRYEPGGAIAIPRREGKGDPVRVLLTAHAEQVLVLWGDGHAVRVLAKDRKNPVLAEEVELLGDVSTLTASALLPGKATLVTGDSRGRVRAYFLTRPPNPAEETPDGLHLVRAHEFPGAGQPVTALEPSASNRLLAAGYADGRVRLYYVTSEKQLADLPTGGKPVTSLLLAPHNDLLIAHSEAGAWRWQVSEGSPEASLGALFLPVWYEGYPNPEHVWQSSGSAVTEPKYGLWPLIFGTLKATFYSLLLGVPLALLAAIFTSEFMHPRTRAVVKPTIEVMASLPSVVLGFLAALVVAPFVERWLAAVLVCFYTIPVALLLGGYLWQLLPPKVSLGLGRWRFLLISLTLPLGIVAGRYLGPPLERVLFGDLQQWLAAPINDGGGTPGWFLILTPLCAVGVWFATNRLLSGVIRSWTARRDQRVAALADLGKFAAVLMAGGALAWAVGMGLTAAGIDPRGSVIGTYVQRNALVVGFMMGFAIIPIIYTLAEDALSAVPEHLRSASLGCGATPWQTAVRVIIPTAMSGLFSAVMVGLGRAVGETMIVLMATGSTPIMDPSAFNGFRTLSANIAIELPEAVRQSTHYRILFLNALVLFGLTFVINTLAEVIRQRFRKRAFQL